MTIYALASSPIIPLRPPVSPQKETTPFGPPPESGPSTADTSPSIHPCPHEDPANQEKIWGEALAKQEEKFQQLFLKRSAQETEVLHHLFDSTQIAEPVQPRLHEHLGNFQRIQSRLSKTLCKIQKLLDQLQLKQTKDMQMIVKDCSPEPIEDMAQRLYQRMPDDIDELKFVQASVPKPAEVQQVDNPTENEWFEFLWDIHTKWFTPQGEDKPPALDDL